MGSDGLSEPECNGICLYAADIGVPEAGDVVAYAHPDCPEHGDPLDEDPNENICGDGDESLRYVREEDMSRGPKADLIIVDEVARYAETGELDRPEDFELAEPSYRIKLSSCHDSALIERTLDAAEMEFLRSLAGQINGLENGGHVDGCVPTMVVSQRIKPGDLDEDENFREVIAPC